MNIKEILNRLEKVKGNHGKYMAICPAHEDKTASLSVSEADDGRVLVHCFAGCSCESICNALNLEVKDLYPNTLVNGSRSFVFERNGTQQRNYPQNNQSAVESLSEPSMAMTAPEYPLSKQNIEAEYIYYPLFSENLQIKYYIKRKTLNKGKKSFFWNTVYLDGREEKGVKPENTVIAPFGAENLKNIQGNSPVFIVEGEKDVHTMNAMGYVTVCLPNGSNSKWEQGYTALFSDKRVFLLGDNDNAGRKYLTHCAENLAETVQEMHVCDVSKLWDRLPDKGDITDIAEAIGLDETNRRLTEYCKNIPVYIPKGSTILLKNVTETPINWLWYPYIARGELTLLVGSGGFGKTTVAVDLAAKFSMGLDFPTQHEKNYTEKGKTLFISAEESLQNTIVLRFRLAGADLSKIEAVDFNQQELFTFTDEAVERAIRRSRAKLIIFDPLAAFLGSGRDTNKFNEIRPVFTHLRRIAEKYDCAIVIIAHLSKVQGMTAQDRVSGSTDIVNACRSVLGVGYVPKKNNEEVDENTRVFTHIKSNLAKHGENILFRWIDDFKIEWQGETTERYTPDEIMNAREFKRDVGRPKDQLTIAEELIRKFLEENNGEMPSAVLKEKIIAEDISERTYESARKKMSVKAYKKDKIWFTMLTDYQPKFN